MFSCHFLRLWCFYNISLKLDNFCGIFLSVIIKVLSTPSPLCDPRKLQIVTLVAHCVTSGYKQACLAINGTLWCIVVH